MGIAWSILRPSALSPGAILVVAGERGVLAVHFLRGGGLDEVQTFLRELGAKPAVARKPVIRKPADVSKTAARAWTSGATRPAVPVPIVAPAPVAAATRRHLFRAVAELEAYFRGRLRDFRVPVDLDGRGTSFERRVWDALRRIPWGAVVSYGQLASRIGRRDAARAVGGAVGRNPIPVILPCHRVVGEAGCLTGFSSGLGLKVSLLEHEGLTITDGKSLARRRVVITPQRRHRERRAP